MKLIQPLVLFLLIADVRSLSYADAERACSDIGVTSEVIEHGGGDYNADGAEAAADNCTRAIHIIENQKAEMDRAIDKMSQGNDPNGN